MKKNNAIILLFSFLVINTTLAFGQTGSIKGVISDKKTKETIVGANIYVEGTTIGTTTNLEGQYELKNLKSGVYNIIVSFISYKKQRFQNVKVSLKEPVIINVELEEEVTSIAGVEVRATRKKDTEVSIINSIKNSDAVVSGVSSQQISKSPDKDASEVVRRIPGVTIIDDRFIVVRGLSERYNTVLLNGSGTPSSESDVKAFSFDVIPSSAIDRILVFKTPSAELPADFAGANIQIVSKNIPEKNTFSISYNSGFKSSTTAKSFHKYDGGATDMFGFDDGTRAIPSVIPSTQDFQAIINNPTAVNKQLRTDFGRAFGKTWESYTTKAPIDQSASVFFARKFKVKKVNISNLSTLSYSNSYSFSENTLASYISYDTINDKSVSSYQFNDKIYSQTVAVNGLMNWAFVLNAKNSIEFKNIFNQQGISKTTLRDGLENNRGVYIQSTELSFNERTLYSGQLNGSHHFFDEKSVLTWTLGYSAALRKQPDVRRLTKTLGFDQDPESPYFNQYSLYFPNRADPELAGRLFTNMNEKLKVFGADLVQKINVLKSLQPSLKMGIYFENKDRAFNSRLFGFVRNSSTPWDIGYKPVDVIFSDTNINSQKGIRIDEATNPSDSYTAQTQLGAGYLMAKFIAFKRITVSGGVRIEKYALNLSSRNANYSKYEKKTDTLDFFPSVNISCQINEKNLLRLAYGKTINRPEFREIAPYIFYNFEEKAGVYGNPELKSAYIQNLDIRYEAYPSPNEMINVGVFYKKFYNPIEAVAINAGSGKNITFKNAETAESFGAELDARKSLKFINLSNRFFSWVNDMSVVLNASLIKSSVTVIDPLERDKNRPMQGQSPYIINTGLFYQNDSAQFSVTLLYNVIGPRIAFVGTVDDPHIYEMPRNLLDLSVSKKFGSHLSVKLGVKNLLNQRIVFQQEEAVYLSSSPTTLTKRIQETKSTIPGSQFNLGITYVF
jgi:hypothetical protein